MLSAVPEETFVFGSDGPNFTGGQVNGQLKPSTLTLQSGTTSRFRIVQINPEMHVFVSLKQGKSNLQWKPVAKDGADISFNRQIVREAHVDTDPGETLDVEVIATAMKNMTLEFSRQTGSWKIEVPFLVRAKATVVQKSHLQ